MAEGDDFGIAHLAAIIDRRVAVDVEDDIVALARDRADNPQIGLIAGGEYHRVLHAVKFLERVLTLLVALECAIQNAAAGGACAKFVERLFARRNHVVVKGHAHVVVRAEQDGFLAIAHRDGRREHLLHHQRKRVHDASGEQAFALGDEGIEFGEQVGHILSLIRHPELVSGS